MRNAPAVGRTKALQTLSLALILGFSGSRPGLIAAAIPEPTLEQIEPGVVIGERTPKGWSHLLVKSVPRVFSGDLDSLPNWAFDTTSMFRTVILVDIRRSPERPDRFLLRRVGVGMCIPVEGRDDVVVERQALAEIGVSLSALERQVLAEAEAELQKGRLVATTPRFALFQTPATKVKEAEHRDVHLYYAILVDPESGRVAAFVWDSMVNGNKDTPPKSLVELTPSRTFDCNLDVRAQRVAGLIPVSWSFAMRSLPPGSEREIPPRLASRWRALEQGRLDPDLVEQAFAEVVETYRFEPTQGGNAPAQGVNANAPGQSRDAVGGSGPARPH